MQVMKFYRKAQLTVAFPKRTNICTIMKPSCYVKDLLYRICRINALYYDEFMMSLERCAHVTELS
jgi:hypothetical protein